MVPLRGDEELGLRDMRIELFEVIYIYKKVCIQFNQNLNAGSIPVMISLTGNQNVIRFNCDTGTATRFWITGDFLGRRNSH